MLADGPKGPPLLPSYDPFIAPLSRLRERRDYGAARLNPGIRSDKNISPGAFFASLRSPSLSFTTFTGTEAKSYATSGLHLVYFLRFSVYAHAVFRRSFLKNFRKKKLTERVR